MADRGIQVIDRALDILELLSVEKSGLGVTEIGSRLGLHKSTVHRILTVMAERGYIEKTKSRGEYRIGLKLVEISSLYLNNVELKTEAKPFLWQLAAKFNLVAHLAILDGNEAVYIEKVDVVHSIRLYSQIGRRIPVHCTALGKSLMSGLPDDEIEKRLKDYRFHKHTDNTIINKEALMKQIAEVRRKGWSIDDEEHEKGVRCIAAPIRDYRGNVIAALSITGSAAIVNEARDEEIARLVVETAENISRRLGFS